MEAKISYDMVEKANEEMRELLDQFPAEEAKDMQQTLVQLENDVIAIRTYLERKTKKITMIQLDKKLDTIVKILNQNGLTCKADE